MRTRITQVKKTTLVQGAIRAQEERSATAKEGHGLRRNGRIHTDTPHPAPNTEDKNRERGAI